MTATVRERDVKRSNDQCTAAVGHGNRWRRASWAAAACLLAGLLQGCAGALVAGAAAGGVMMADRRAASTIVEDQSIEMKAMQAINQNDEVVERARINVTSYNNVVLLTGEAPTAELRDRAIAAVRPVEGIKRIHNEIAIAEPAPLSVRSNDALITGRVKSALLAARGINPMHVKVVTSRGTVYLMGLVTRAEAGFATDIARRIEGVERVVRIFEYRD